MHIEQHSIMVTIEFSAKASLHIASYNTHAAKQTYQAIQLLRIIGWLSSHCRVEFVALLSMLLYTKLDL